MWLFLIDHKFDVLVQEGGGGWGRISCRVDEKWERSGIAV